MIKLTANGILQSITWKDTTIQFREDGYRGPALLIWPHQKESEPTYIIVNKVSDDKFVGQYGKVDVELSYVEENEGVEIKVALMNKGEEIFAPKKCELRLGIDTYMVGYPEWNDKFFCTMLRTEKTHTWGYMRTPAGKVVAIATKGPVASWHHCYSRADYGGSTTDTGHRIYTMSLDLLNKGPLPKRHPQDLDHLEPRETKVFEVLLKLVESEAEIKPVVEAYTQAALPTMDKYTYEYGEKPSISCKGEVTYTSPSGKIYTKEQMEALNEYGVWQVVASYNDKVSEALIYVRKPWSYYLYEARKATLKYEQKAGTHTEGWYGFFSSFLARKYQTDATLDKQLEEKFEEVFRVMHDMEQMVPVGTAEPGRIQNTALMISLLADAYEATQNIMYLERGARLAEHVMKYQSADGAYRCGYGVHYTCVIYIAKSLIELYQVERQIKEDYWQNLADKHYISIKRAIDELRDSRDDIQTEGEMTFEDGMISCSSLQLGLFALMQEDLEARAGYEEVARYMLEKHKCLELQQIPDCRMRGATLRFWETMYDVMIPQNMMTSPHGWTSWKTYATYYLYRLTGDKAYLKDTMDTLGASMQVIDIETGELRWAFIVDPYVEAQIFVPNEQVPGQGKLVSKVVGEEYISMVSDWWKCDQEQVTHCYAFPNRGEQEGHYKGGACDNDVHEHFKCLEEVALTKAYVHQDQEELLNYNCKVAQTAEGMFITPSEDLVEEIVISINGPCTVHIEGWDKTQHLEAGMHSILR
ncbi:hypothetical protein [Niameybacter massiliensis]|uniref:hypothetical protein n=1 Tax=Niameybacter massiliensis TaxID=1658108 RepID=UPI0006B63582|nr:hypothetical protein [Niameybacter massiliensis]